MKIRISGAGFVLIAALILLTACEANRRYEILSFFFDGVPLPETGEAGGPEEDQPAGAGQQKNRVYQHGPFGARFCSACHDKNTNRLILPEEELCLFCHTLPRKYSWLHGPLAAGGCTVCHDPHVTSNPALLVSDARDFCLYCHVREDVMKTAVHRETGETCTHCHDAHGADNRFLLKTPDGETGGTAGQTA